MMGIFLLYSIFSVELLRINTGIVECGYQNDMRIQLEIPKM